MKNILDKKEKPEEFKNRVLKQFGDFYGYDKLFFGIGEEKEIT